ncbi:MAG TPA: DUF2480 family protein [Sediminibacterium sp.]|nr:DUF2480 family protein [Sediminibacterium sp.]
MSEILVNKVAASGLVTLDLAEFYPKEEIVLFDLKDFLFMGLILKEKDFRTALQELDWTGYQDKIVAITCSTDAIIPVWAYMLVAAYLQPRVKALGIGTEEQVRKEQLCNAIRDMDTAAFQDQRVVIKGCGELPIGEDAYLAITAKLLPVVKSIMYGEPCSTVPIYKRK